MHLHVRVEQRLGVKVLLADVAGIRLVAGVVPDVDVERVPLREALAAQLASVRLLVGVNPLVDLQQHLLPEALPAVRARVRFLPGVRLHVTPQTALRGQRFPAELAHVRDVLMVALHVQLVPLATVVDLLALLALELWLEEVVAMRLHVPLKLALVAQHAAALRAGEDEPSMLGVVVLLVVEVRVEAFAALFARLLVAAGVAQLV